MLFSYSFYVWVFGIAVLSVETTAEQKQSVTCSEPSIFQNINVTRILGHWYGYSRYDHDFEQGCDCYTTEVTLVDPISFNVDNCCQMTSVSNESQVCNIGFDTVRISNPEKNEALYLFTRNGAESGMWIVDTDYENYMIVNACEQVSDDEERELLWIMTRDNGISENVAKKIDDTLRANNFEMNKIFKQRHGADVCQSKRPQRNRVKVRGQDGQGHDNQVDGQGNQ